MTEAQVTTQPAPLPPPGNLPPCPWSVPDGGVRPEIHDENGRVICRMADTGDAMEAAATLIASAPKLLAALEDMVALVQEHFEAAALSEDEGDDLTRRFDKAASLITKARGL